MMRLHPFCIVKTGKKANARKKSSLAQEGEPLAFTIGKDSVVEFLGRYDGEISPFDDPPGEDSKRESAAGGIGRYRNNKAGSF